MSNVCALTGLRSGQVFVDLGSGVGNTLACVSVATGADSYGAQSCRGNACLLT